MPAPNAYEYAVIRFVPRVERGECMNVGVVLFCRTRRFLDARIHLDPARLTLFAPAIDIDVLTEHLTRIPLICRGGTGTGPIGELPTHERFRWLTAPRSTILQPSPVHSGMCDDPADTLDRLAAALLI